MSKKLLATLSFSLLTLAACNAPADVTNDGALEEEESVPSEITIENVILEDIAAEEEAAVEDVAVEADAEAAVEAEIVE